MKVRRRPRGRWARGAVARSGLPLDPDPGLIRSGARFRPRGLGQGTWQGSRPSLQPSPPQLGEFAQLDRVGTVGTRNRARAGGRLGGLSFSSPPPPRRLASFDSECCSRPLPSHLRLPDHAVIRSLFHLLSLPSPSCPLSSSGFSFPVPALLRPRAASPPRFHPRHP